jgi:hypothetical protein
MRAHRTPCARKKPMTRRIKPAQTHNAQARRNKMPISLLELPVVGRCSDAYDAAYKEALAKGEHNFTAKEIAAKSYRTAMPAPLDLDSTRDFIACVTFGVLTDVFTLKMANSLYYAAQIALSHHRNNSGKGKKA